MTGIVSGNGNVHSGYFQDVWIIMKKINPQVHFKGWMRS